jgi:hypothetical protein
MPRIAAVAIAGDQLGDMLKHHHLQILQQWVVAR